MSIIPATLEVNFSINGIAQTDAPIILFNADRSVCDVEFTDKKGKCFFYGILPSHQTYTLMSFNPGNSLYQLNSILILRDTSVSLKFAGAGTIGSIQVIVLTNPPIQPISNARVDILPNNASGGELITRYTNSNGEVYIDDIVGSYDVKVTANGSQQVQTASVVPDGSIMLNFSF